MDDMTADKLIEQAHKIAQSAPLYRYNPQVLEQTIREGVIPDGATIAAVSGQRLVRNGDEIVCYTDDGRVTKRTKVTDELMPKLLVQYAVQQAKNNIVK